MESGRVDDITIIEITGLGKSEGSSKGKSEGKINTQAALLVDAGANQSPRQNRRCKRANGHNGLRSSVMYSIVEFAEMCIVSAGGQEYST